MGCLLWISCEARPISWRNTFSTSPSQSTFLLGFPKMPSPSSEPLLMPLLLQEEPTSKVSWNFGNPLLLLLLLLLLLVLELAMNEASEEKLVLNPEEADEECWKL